MIQASFLSDSNTCFGLEFGNVQHDISEELLGIRAHKLSLNDQRLMALWPS